MTRKVRGDLKARLLELMEEWKKPKDPKKWAKDILNDPNYTNAVGIELAQKALDPRRLKGTSNDES